MNECSLCIIIVNYRTGAMVADSLRRIADFRTRGLFGETCVTTVVVDNNSLDDSTDLIASTIRELSADDWCALLISEDNRGFSAGNNKGIRCAIKMGWGDGYFLLLNPDALLLENTVSGVIKLARTMITPSIIGCTQTNEVGEVRPSAFRFPSPLTEFQRGANLGLLTKFAPKSCIVSPIQEHPFRADWVTGAAMLLPSCVYARVGDFDEDFFLYYEEVEYMHRAKGLGVDVWSSPDSRVIHYAGASTGIKKGVSNTKRTPAYWYQSWSLYFLKTQGSAKMYLCALCWLSGHAVNTLLSLVAPHRRIHSQNASDFIRYAIFGARK